MSTYFLVHLTLPSEFQRFSFKVFATDASGKIITGEGYSLEKSGYVQIPVVEGIGSYFPYRLVLRNGVKTAGFLEIPDKKTLAVSLLSEKTGLQYDKALCFKMVEWGQIQFNPTLITDYKPIKEPDMNMKEETQEPTVILSMPKKVESLKEYPIKGRIIDKKGEPFKAATFIIYVQDHTKTEEEGRYFPLLTAHTDQLGSFQISVQNKSYSGAKITVGAAYDEPIEINLTQEGKLPEFTLVVTDYPVEAYKSVDDDDCGCGVPPDRLPEMEDLLNPDNKYQQDIGGSCVNFTTPNRALEEFSFYKIVRTTDPEVVSQEILFQIEAINEQLRNLRSQLLNLQRYKSAAVYENTQKLAGKGVNPNTPTQPMAGSETEIRNLENQIADLEGKRNALYRGASGRRSLGMEFSVDWDQTPTTFQATTIAHGHILEFRQVWRADGYSMGDLLYSLPLAPGQKKQIAIFDWDRRESASRTEDQTQEESLQNTLSRDRDVSDIVKSTLNESLEGSSSSNSNSTTKSISATMGTPPVSPVSASVTAGISNTKSSASSESSQQSSRDLAASSMQQLRDKTMQSASSLRSQRSTVIQAVNQGESMNVTTESVANYNHCHAITIQYFEVLRHFALSTELADVKECLFVPLPMTLFDNAKVMRWREILVKAVGNRWFLRGFDAVARAEQARIEGPNTTAYADLPPTRYCDERFTYIDVKIRLRCHLARPAEIYPADTPTLQTLMTTTATGIFGITSPQVLLEEAQKAALLNHPADLDNWRVQIGFIPGWTHIRNRVLNAPREQRDIVFQQEIEAADWISHFIDKTVLSLEGILPIPGSLRILNRSNPKIDKFRNGSAGRGTEVTVGVTYNEPAGVPITRERISKLTYQIAYVGGNTPAITQMPDGTSIRMVGGSGRYRTRTFSGLLFNEFTSPLDLAQGDRIDIPTPLTHEEMRNPRQELERARVELLQHLNNNLEVYHSWLFYYMSPERRYMMLDGIQVKVPNRHIPGQPQPGPNDFTMRSVASVVENRIISIVGNTMVMPVASGFNLDPTFRYDDDLVTLDDGRKVSLLMYHYMPEKGFKSAPFRISVPTKGVFAEAVTGACNSCEKIDDTRFWKWEEHPIPDSPTGIQTISTDSRRAEVGNLQAKEFAQPMVNIQNAPEAPAYGGVAAALEAITKNDAFRDATGLAGTQELVKEGLKASGEAQKHAMEKAAEITKQAMNQKNNQSLTQQIKNSGLPKEKQQELMEELLRSQISGKTQKDDPNKGGGEKPKKPVYGPDSMKVVASGSEQGKGDFVQYADGRTVYVDDDGNAVDMGKKGKDEFGNYTIDKYGRKIYDGDTTEGGSAAISPRNYTDNQQDALRSTALNEMNQIIQNFNNQFPAQDLDDNNQPTA